MMLSVAQSRRYSCTVLASLSGAPTPAQCACPCGLLEWSADSLGARALKMVVLRSKSCLHFQRHSQQSHGTYSCILCSFVRFSPPALTVTVRRLRQTTPHSTPRQSTHRTFSLTFKDTKTVSLSSNIFLTTSSRSLMSRSRRVKRPPADTRHLSAPRHILYARPTPCATPNPPTQSRGLHVRTLLWL